MSVHHKPDCAFAMSFGDLGCDCNGPAEAPPSLAEESRSRLTATAQEHLAAARAALRGPKADA